MLPIINNNAIIIGERVIKKGRPRDQRNGHRCRKGRRRSARN